jgi:hypothetical protein
MLFFQKTFSSRICYFVSEYSMILHQKKLSYKPFIRMSLILKKVGVTAFFHSTCFLFYVPPGNVYSSAHRLTPTLSAQLTTSLTRIVGINGIHML